MENNKLIADFIGMQKTDMGYYDYEELLNLPYTQDNTFDVLLFDKSWDWLIPVIQLCKERQVFGTQNLINNMDDVFACDLEIEHMYGVVVTFIKFYNKNKQKE